jgi:hypothetical protein
MIPAGVRGGGGGPQMQCMVPMVLGCRRQQNQPRQPVVVHRSLVRCGVEALGGLGSSKKKTLCTPLRGSVQDATLVGCWGR